MSDYLSDEDVYGPPKEKSGYLSDEEVYGTKPGRTVLGTAADIGVTAAKGVVGLGSAAVGLGNLATGGLVGRGMDKLGYDPTLTQNTLSDLYSDPQKEANAKVGSAEGFVGTVGAMVKNPSTIGHAIVETVPLMLAGGGVGAVARNGITKLAPKLATRFAPATLGTIAGATGEGVIGAGSMAEDIRQQMPDKELTAKGAMYSGLAGIGTSAFGLAGGRLAQKLGFADPDTMLAMGTLNPAGEKVGVAEIAKRIIGGGISEGAFEELPQSIQETMFQNAALGKPLMEGVPESAAQGLVVGGFMGGAANMLPSASSTVVEDPAAEPTIPENTNPAANGIATPANDTPSQPPPAAPAPPAAPVIQPPAPTGVISKALAMGGIGALPSQQVMGPQDQGTQNEQPGQPAVVADQSGGINGVDPARLGGDPQKEMGASPGEDTSPATTVDRIPDGKPAPSIIAQPDGQGFLSESILKKHAADNNIDLAGYNVTPDPATNSGFIATRKDADIQDVKGRVDASGRTLWAGSNVIPAQAGIYRPAEAVEASEPTNHAIIANPDSVAHGQEVNAAPSEAMAEAGNYKKAHVSLDGLNITVENPAGTTRSGTDKDGKAWSIEMKADYGYVKGSVGYDKDHVDVVMAPGYQGGSQDAYIVNQHNKDGKFDEHKVVLGVTSEAEAMEVYNSNYESGWDGGKSVVKMPVDKFREWVKSSAPKKGAVVGQAVESQELTTKPVDVNETANSETQTLDLVEHVTKGGKGKIIKGIVRTDLTKEEAQAIDKYTFKKDGGFFIREKYLAGDNSVTNSVTNKTADVADQQQDQAVAGDISGDISGAPKEPSLADSIAESESNLEVVRPGIKTGKEVASGPNMVLMNARPLNGDGEAIKISAPHDGTKEDAHRVARALKLYASEEHGASMRQSEVFGTDKDGKPAYAFTQGEGNTLVVENTKTTTDSATDPGQDTPAEPTRKKMWEQTKSEFVDGLNEHLEEMASYQDNDWISYVTVQRDIGSGSYIYEAYGKDGKLIASSKSIAGKGSISEKLSNRKGTYNQYESAFYHIGKNEPFSWAWYQEQRNQYSRDLHQEQVKHAIAEGKAVPDSVLADYPDLAQANPEATNEADQPQPEGGKTAQQDNQAADVASPGNDSAAQLENTGAASEAPVVAVDGEVDTLKKLKVESDKPVATPENNVESTQLQTFTKEQLAGVEIKIDGFDTRGVPVEGVLVDAHKELARIDADLDIYQKLRTCMGGK